MRRVARKGRQAGTEPRVQPAGEAVAREALERHDFGSRINGGERLAVALDGIGVLLGPPDRSFGGEPRGGRNHVGITVRPGREGWAFVAFGAFRRGGRPVEAQRRATEALHAAGDDEIGFAGPDLGGGHQDRIEPGTALGVDGGGRHGFGEAGGKGCDPCRIAAAIKRIAEHQRVDGVGGKAGIGEQGRDRRGGQSMGLRAGEGSAARRDGGATGRDDENRRNMLHHGDGLTRATGTGPSARPWRAPRNRSCPSGSAASRPWRHRGGAPCRAAGRAGHGR